MSDVFDHVGLRGDAFELLEGTRRHGSTPHLNGDMVRVLLDVRRPVDANSVYSFHMYPFTSDTRAAELSGHAAIAEAQQMPFWCGEFGVNTPAWVAETAAMYDAPANHVSGRAYWTWKQVKGENQNFLVGIDDSMPTFDRLMGWTRSGWTTSMPTTDQVLTGVEELAAASALDRCEVDAEMATAIRGR